MSEENFNLESTRVPVITVDGPGGSGKGTLSQLLATSLGWHYLDSGTLYRVLAYLAAEQGVALSSEDELARLAATIPVKFIPETDGKLTLLLRDVDISQFIRTEAIANNASIVSAFPKVRRMLVALQRSFRKLPGLVTDGRDMGTVIFPDAALKFFIVATPQERARRRYKQLKEKGINVSLAGLCDELIERDRRDQERPVAPLLPAVDAIVIDTTNLSITEALESMQASICRAGLSHER